MKEYNDYSPISFTDKAKAKSGSKNVDIVRKYLPYAAAFDIETSSIVTNTDADGEVKSSHVYLWQFAIKTEIETAAYYGRTIEEFIEFLDIVRKKQRMMIDEYMVIYVHNLQYEFQFIRKYFEWERVFAIDSHAVLQASIPNFEFRCSYKLSGMSLANLSKEIGSVNKLVGDLDHTKIRHHETPLTKEEIQYAENDVLIVVDYIDKKLNETIDAKGKRSHARIQLTKTGEVRHFVNRRCIQDGTGNSRRYRNLMKSCTLTRESYTTLNNAFKGGFTHGNENYAGMVLENVSSYDLASSYPTVLVTEKFPVSSFNEMDVKELRSILADEDNRVFGLSDEYVIRYYLFAGGSKRRDNHALMVNVTFYNIIQRSENVAYISENSRDTNVVNGVIFNGKVKRADSVTMTVTDVHLKIIYDLYEWDEMDVNTVYEADKEYLPKVFVDSILDLYEKKTTLKGVEGMEDEYNRSKAMINSVYGMCVQDIVRDEISYTADHKWVETKKGELTDEKIEAQIKQVNESKSRFTYYAWGVWVTAYAQSNLFHLINGVGDDFVYCDTDSVKMLNGDKHVDLVESLNQSMIDKLKECGGPFLDDIRHKMNPKTRDGVEKTLGMWEFEGCYEKFKNLGAKRYMCYSKGPQALHGEFHTTVAGLKKKAVDYLIRKAKELLGEEGDWVSHVFAVFSDQMIVPAGDSGRLTHYYQEEEVVAEVTDYLGNTTEVVSKSSLHIEESDYTLSTFNTSGADAVEINEANSFKMAA